MKKNNLIDKIFRLTYKFNSKIYDVLIDGNKIVFAVSLDFNENNLHQIKKEFSEFQVIIEKE